MKACISNGGDNVRILSLKPETDEEQVVLRNFADMLGRPHLMNCRGFQYLNPEVEFYVQPMPSRD